jgi:hypothetical protein
MILRYIACSEHNAHIPRSEALAELNPLPVTFLQINKCAQSESVLIQLGFVTFVVVVKPVEVKALLKFNNIRTAFTPFLLFVTHLLRYHFTLYLTEFSLISNVFEMCDEGVILEFISSELLVVSEHKETPYWTREGAACHNVEGGE